jgi:hypothetical protein
VGIWPVHGAIVLLTLVLLGSHYGYRWMYIRFRARNQGS